MNELINQSLINILNYALEIFLIMRYINLHYTYLLTYILTYYVTKPR